MRKVHDFLYKNTHRSAYRIDTKVERYHPKNYLIDTGQDSTQEGSTQQLWNYFLSHD